MEAAAAASLSCALVAAGVFYYVFNYVVAFAMEKWEQVLRYYR